MIISIILLFASVAASTSPAGCPGQSNALPLLNLPLTPLKTVSNGASYVMQQDTNVLYFAKVSGTPFEMGYALGQLYGAEIANNLEGMVEYGDTLFQNYISEYVQASWLTEILYDFGVVNLAYALLDLNWMAVYPFVPSRFEEEMWGIAFGSGFQVDYLMLRRINMIPEITRAACTIIGAQGTATADGKLYHLRTLDWQPTAPVNKYPAIIIYEPTEAGSNTFANIGYLGLVGTFTAMSKNGITVGEKVMYVKQATDYPENPTYTYLGKPWMYVLRDAAQFAKSMADIESELIAAARTAMLHLGFGSLPDNTFRGVDYASNLVIFYNDQNYTRYSAEHPQMNGIFFYDKHVQPSTDPCVANILTAALGSITPATLYRDVAGFHETGNAQVVAMDPQGQQLWLSFSQYGAAVNAYQRNPIYVDLSTLW